MVDVACVAFVPLEGFVSTSSAGGTGRNAARSLGTPGLSHTFDQPCRSGLVWVQCGSGCGNVAVVVVSTAGIDQGIRDFERTSCRRTWWQSFEAGNPACMDPRTAVGPSHWGY